MQSLITSLNWREATKQFDSTKKLTDEQLDTLLEAIRLAPSSFGLQPWSFVVVTDPLLRKELRAASWDQPQVTDASHLIVFTAKMPTEELVDAYIADIAATRGVTPESLDGFAQMMKDSIAGKNEADRLTWAKKQVYLSLGVALTSAAVLNIDSCPMEGFDAVKYDELLGLNELGLHTVAILPVGFRSDAETGYESKKVRFSKENLIIKK